jgi:large subunit ribosomal protein L15
MPLKSTHKRKKYSRMHGRKMGTAGTGARKMNRKSGHKGGVGMAGSGKRADHKKTLINKLYGNNYFGKQGVTSRGTKRDKRQRINLGQIQSQLDSFVKKGIAKKVTSGFEINLSKYKILRSGDVKDKFFITALEASTKAIEKISKAGGKVTLLKLQKNKEEEQEESNGDLEQDSDEE